MQVYRVGGAVRDALLGLPIKDVDYVVIGATVEQMLARGYQPVGRDFPVFLHPQTHEQYALARTEKKIARGYHGFQFYTAPDLTLEDDLYRRDLTINAIAQDENGSLIDPYGGVSDIKQRVLRHVSPAFAEDPVRILRVARFAARYAPLGFRIAPQTMRLMRDMVQGGETGALVAERIWNETERALVENKPQVFFSVLRECGALATIFPEINALFGVPQTAKWHPEIDTGVHTLMVLQQAARLTTDGALNHKQKLMVRFAALVHDLGKGITPSSQWPKHIQHESRGVPLVKNLCRRLKTPAYLEKSARVFTEQHLLYHRALELKPATLVKLIQKLNAFRDPWRMEFFILAGEADSRGRKGFEQQTPPQSDYLRQVFAAVQQVDPQSIIQQGYQGQEISRQLFTHRCQAIVEIKKQR